MCIVSWAFISSPLNDIANQLTRDVFTMSSMPSLASQAWAKKGRDSSGRSSGRSGGSDRVVFEGPAEANEGAFEGGETESLEDAGINLNLGNLRNDVGIDVGFDIPTGGQPSPLFGALPFTQHMLREEEYGIRPLGTGIGSTSVLPAFPQLPQDDPYGSGPQGHDIDNLLAPGYDGISSSALKDLPGEMYPMPEMYSYTPELFTKKMEGFINTTGLPDEEAYFQVTGLTKEAFMNPWKAQIEGLLGHTLESPPREGRPPGDDWAHQRWDEFSPTHFVQTAQAGARDNGGVRDHLQLHGYSAGEWAEGGLYHNTVGPAPSGHINPDFNGTTKGIPVKFHPNFPVQDPNALWTWDGTFPPKLLMARYGEPILLRHYNLLPLDPSANHGFGIHTISTHEHNGHNPAESDGYTQSFFFPGQYYDYHWPMILAGHDSLNTEASDPRAGTPDGHGGIKKIRGNWRETMSTHWFHDHMLDFTAQNVYKGNASMMNYYSAVDRGREPASEEEAQGSDAKPGYGCHYADEDNGDQSLVNPNNVNLCFPSGSALDWGNRDYDINLLVADKAWDQEGQLWFNIFNTDGFLGDHLLTNFVWKPFFDVRARQYRFRILNGSVSRYLKIALVTESGEPVPFYMIANDGNIMEHSVYFDNAELPTQGIAERYDIVVDFSQFEPGTKLYMVNLLEHKNGKRPEEAIPIEEVLSGDYAAQLKDGRWEKADPAVGKFLEFRVTSCYDSEGINPVTCPDYSMDPADYVAGKKKMIPRPSFTQEELENAVHRTFDFGRSGGTDSKPWTIKTDGGAGLNMDPRRLSAAPDRGSVEIWHIENGGGGWSHPIHVHFEEGQIFRRGGEEPPEWERWARKDVYRVGRMDDSQDSVDFAIRFREFMGSYMEHCHNTQHEDHAMLLRWDIENPGQVQVMATPMPTWNGVTYVNTVALPTYKTGDLDAAEDAGGDFGALGQ